MYCSFSSCFAQLEDKVAALEAKNQLTEQENENLRDLLQRLQNENMMLKQAAFTFTAPRNTAPAPQHSFNTNNSHSMQFNFSSPGAGPSKSPMQTQSPPSQFDINFNSLISFDPSMINPAEDMGEPMDTSFSHNTNHYVTVASNPMFTSFVERSPADSPPIMMNSGNQHFSPSFDFSGDHWTPPEGGGQDALEQIFGGNFLTSGSSGVDFHALLASPPSSLSPVSHASMRTPSLSSSSSSPGAATNGSPSANGASPSGVQHGGECPKTKEQLSKVIAEGGQSSFVQPSTSSSSPAASGNDKMHVDGATCEAPFAPFLRKATGEDGGTPFVMCRGSSFPKTQKSDKNIEVLTAWRTITSNPQFKVGVFARGFFFSRTKADSDATGSGCGHQRAVHRVYEQGAVRRDQGRARARGRAPHHRGARCAPGQEPVEAVRVGVGFPPCSALPLCSVFAARPRRLVPPCHCRPCCHSSFLSSSLPLSARASHRPGPGALVCAAHCQRGTRTRIVHVTVTSSLTAHCKSPYRLCIVSQRFVRPSSSSSIFGSSLSPFRIPLTPLPLPLPQFFFDDNGGTHPITYTHTLGHSRDRGSTGAQGGRRRNGGPGRGRFTKAGEARSSRRRVSFRAHWGLEAPRLPLTPLSLPCESPTFAPRLVSRPGRGLGTPGGVGLPG